MRLAVAFVVCLVGVAGSAFAQVPTRADDAVIQTLTQRDVFVAPQLAGSVDEPRLQRVADDLKPFTVKFAIVPLPDRNSRNAWAASLRRYLNVRDGAVIVLAPKMEGIRGGVSASSDVISPQEISRIVEANMATFSTQGYTQGLEQLARALREHVVAQQRRTALNVTMLIGIPTVLVLSGVAWVVRRRAQEVARLKNSLQDLRAQVLEGIEYLDGYIDVLPEGEDASRAREHRQRAAELQTQAVELMQRAKRPEDLWRAEHLLDKAQRAIENAKKYILRAGGDTTIQVEEDMGESVAAESSLIIVPNDRTYACYFCSKPPTLGELQPVEITVGEKTQKVWACEECAQQLQRGQPPKVRVFRDDDQVRPWFDHPDYDPYRDYGRPYPGMDWVSLLLLGSLLYDAGQASTPQEPPDMGSHVPDPVAGGADWLGYELGDTTADTYANSGGADFFGEIFGNEGWSDTGGADFFDDTFDGASDSDAGGADFGDFGGFGNV